MSGEAVLDVRDLQTHFFLRRGVLKAVDGVSFSLHRGEVLGLVGESGCGKSLTARAVMGLLPPVARRRAGTIELDGRDIAPLDEAGMAASTANAGRNAISVSAIGRNFARQLLRAPSAPKALQRASDTIANQGARRTPS